MKRWILGLILIFTTVLSYQNCSEISLLPPATDLQLLKSEHASSIRFCVEDDGLEERDLFGSPVVINLNVIPDRANFLTDTDMDGLADSNEQAPFSINNPRSLPLLDVICANADCSAITCNETDYYQLGVTLCDIQSYTNLGDAYNILDSDERWDADFIEMIRYGDPFRSPAQISGGDPDTDGDGRGVLQEIIDHTDPGFNDSGRDVTKFRPIKTQIANDSECPFPSKLYEIKIPDLPFVPVAAFADTKSLTVGTEQLNLSHGVNENIIAVYLITYTTGQLNPIYSGHLYLGRIKDPIYSNPGESILQNFTISNDDFVNLGEWGGSP